jgi:uncharacterized protein (DUF885 family)
VHRGRLDRDGRVDLDLALLLLERARADGAHAATSEEAVAAAAAPGADLAFLLPPGPPDAAAAARLSAPGLVPEDIAARPAWPAAAPAPTAPLLRAAAARARALAGLLRDRAAQVAVLHGEAGAAAPVAADAAAKLLEARAGAIDGAAAALEKERGGTGAPCGRERFVLLLRLRHAVDATPERLEEYGHALLDRTTAELEALAAAHFPGRGWREALDEVRRDHPPADRVAAEALRAAEEARDFCIARGLVTIPEEARRVHAEMVRDDMARSYPFAAYGWRRADAGGESGRYMISPGATWMDAGQRAERLRGQARAWTRVVAPHECWPGHHLQIFVADRHASPVRRAAGTPVVVEGWGLYSEALLDRHGWFSRPEERLALLSMRAWRACRVVIDVGLHCRGMDPGTAAGMLVARAGLTRDAAEAEVRRYLSDPTQPFSYAWGWGEIEALRADAAAAEGPAFSERDFHDRLLRAGPIPVPFLRRALGVDPDGDPGEDAIGERLGGRPRARPARVP